MLATVVLVTLTVALFVELGRHTHPVDRRTPWRDLTTRDVVRHVREGISVLNRLSVRR
ncbi:hypothetical protein ACHAAC_00615 [Aeromicrobium sp. CF4.19]|uniref:hypothetical protein n=1 Tax=Aeromicrobium sp. CF4.19 TaxID=3373082 RepID=UPI003EE4BAE2